MDTSTYLKVKDKIDEVLVAARLLEHAREDGDSTVNLNEDRLDDAICAYMRARRSYRS